MLVGKGVPEPKFQPKEMPVTAKQLSDLQMRARWVLPRPP